jgi:hypothetical protein
VQPSIRPKLGSEFGSLPKSLFRDLNERVQEVVTTMALALPSALEIFCECGSADCVAKITLRLAEYEAVRAHPERFFIVAGHEIPDVEDVVEQRTGYWVVEKHEPEAQIARERDPRS